VTPGLFGQKATGEDRAAPLVDWRGFWRAAISQQALQASALLCSRTGGTPVAADPSGADSGGGSCGGGGGGGGGGGIASGDLAVSFALGGACCFEGTIGAEPSSSSQSYSSGCDVARVAAEAPRYRVRGFVTRRGTAHPSLFGVWCLCAPSSRELES